ncbi:MAG: DNA translocase FtsK [Planctomycetota bacterium]
MNSEKTKEIAALLLLGAALFVGLSVASFAEVDLIGRSQPKNLCGVLGYHLARVLLFSFGYAAYVLVFCLAFWGAALFRRAPVHLGALKIAGLYLLVLSLSGLLSHLFQGMSTSLPDPGGYLGIFVNLLLVERVKAGVMGTRIILACLVLVTFILATDWLFYAALSSVIDAWRERVASVKRARRAASRASVLKASAAASEPEDAPEASPADIAAAIDAGEALDERPAAPEAEMADVMRPARGEAPRPARQDPPGNRARGKRLLESVGDFFGGKQRRNAASPDAAAGPADPGEAELEIEAAAQITAARPRRPPRISKGGPLLQPDASFDMETVRVAPPESRTDTPYQFPSLEFLAEHEPVPERELEKTIRENSRRLEHTLRSFKIDGTVVEIRRGPVITMYEVELAPGIKVDRIRSLEDDLAMALRAHNVRIVAPLPGKSTVGIEVPNVMRETVRMKELLNSDEYRSRRYAIPLFLGKDASGHPLIEDLAQMPHLLVAGSTGSGKSVCLNSIIMSILYARTPDQVKLIMIDPKMVELSAFQSIPHLMCPVVTEMKRAAAILEWATQKMEDRYELLHEAGVRNIYAYNELGHEELRRRVGNRPEEESPDTMPFIVIIVDEFADLMMTAAKEVEGHITRLAQKSRAVGIHIVLATQRPSTNVITGLIKANLPTRISFMVATKIDSRVVLDANGAERLLGQGDMLYMPPRSSSLVRAQGSFIDDREIRRTVDFLKETSQPRYSTELVQARSASSEDPAALDELYEDAVRFVLETQRGSASLLQRRFKIGYTRASRLIDLMAGEGLLGDYKGSQAREVTVSVEEWEQGRKAKAAAAGATEG